MKHYLSIKPGETAVIKKSAKILSVINYGNVTSSTTCAKLPDAESAMCYRLVWTASGDGDNHNLSFDTSLLKSIEILGVVYNIGLGISDEAGILTKIIATIPSSIMHNPAYTQSSSQYNETSSFTFQTLPAVADTIKANFTSTSSFADGLYVTPTQIDCPDAELPAD